MLVSWYLPTVGFSLWPCVVLLVVFIPVSIWHERNWRKTLAEYARARREAGAPEGAWPSASLAHVMGVQPGLILAACGLLAIVVVVAAATALMWPQTPPGFDLPINPLDLPFIWSMVVAATAAIVAGVAIAIDVWRNPWSKVAKPVRRAIYARPDVRAKLFAEALAVDPGLRSSVVAPAPMPTPPAAIDSGSQPADDATGSAPPPTETP